jgi:hypothetical protein
MDTPKHDRPDERRPRRDEREETAQPQRSARPDEDPVVQLGEDPGTIEPDRE